MQLWFNVHQDESVPPDDSSMYLDDVSVTNSQAAPPTVPGAPTGVTASAGNSSATVNWTAPGSGGSPITGYTVTPYLSGVAQAATTVTGTPPAATATVTGLTNGQSYTFTVTAANAIGSGPSSAQSNAVTPTASLAPATFVQQVGAHSSGVASLAVTPAAAATTGNRLVVMTGIWASSGPTAKTVTDSAGNTYTEVLHFKASDGTEISVLTAPITAGGGTKPTITVTPTAKADAGVEVLEYSGPSTAAGAAAVDQLASATGTTSGAATGRPGSSGPTRRLFARASEAVATTGNADGTTRDGL